jgi:ribosomal protein S18 acetylase RimI-like enzyme
MDVSIEKAGPADLDPLCDLLARQFAEHRIAAPPAKVRAALSGLLKDRRRGTILVARSADGLAGMAILAFCWTVEHGGQSAWLDELYVREELREQGLGGRLLDEALREARRFGCAAVDLEVDQDHERAERLYRRRGFRSLGRRRWVLPLSHPSAAERLV